MDSAIRTLLHLYRVVQFTSYGVLHNIVNLVELPVDCIDRIRYYQNSEGMVGAQENHSIIKLAVIGAPASSAWRQSQVPSIEIY